MMTALSPPVWVSQTTPPVYILIKIREARRAQNLSVRALAKVTDISFAELSKLERGHRRPAIDHLARIASVLQVSPWPDLVEVSLTPPATEEPANVV